MENESVIQFLFPLSNSFFAVSCAFAETFFSGAFPDFFFGRRFLRRFFPPDAPDFSGFFSSPKELFLVIRSGLFFRLHGNELNVDHGIHMDLCQIEGAVVSARCSVDVDAAH